MISYRDRTFCPYWLQCADGATCRHALTLEVVRDAHKWWGGTDAPISQYAEKPFCFKEDL